MDATAYGPQAIAIDVLGYRNGELVGFFGTV
jgi:hypothetical protein